MKESPPGETYDRVFVWSELEASALTGEADPHVAGNRIIVLAERIKAERAVAAMR